MFIFTKLGKVSPAGHTFFKFSGEKRRGKSPEGRSHEGVSSTKHSGTLGGKTNTRIQFIYLRTREKRTRERERIVTSCHPLGRFQKQQSTGYLGSVNHLTVVVSARDSNKHAHSFLRHRIFISVLLNASLLIEFVQCIELHRFRRFKMTGSAADTVSSKKKFCNRVKWRVIPFFVFFFVIVAVLLGVYRFRGDSTPANDAASRHSQTRQVVWKFIRVALDCHPFRPPSAAGKQPLPTRCPFLLGRCPRSSPWSWFESIYRDGGLAVLDDSAVRRIKLSLLNNVGREFLCYFYAF